MACPFRPKTPFYRFNSSPEIIRLVVMMYVKFPLSLRNVEDLLHERGTDICHETVRQWWNRFGPMFASEIRQRRVQAMRLQPWLTGSPSWPEPSRGRGGRALLETSCGWTDSTPRR
jgi:hypothetical protein